MKIESEIRVANQKCLMFDLNKIKNHVEERIDRLASLDPSISFFSLILSSHIVLIVFFAVWGLILSEKRLVLSALLPYSFVVVVNFSRGFINSRDDHRIPI
jgi:hypothetical protein